MKSELLRTNHGPLPSRTLIYVNTRRGVFNLWTQPVDGGAPKESTDFKIRSHLLFRFLKRRQTLALARDTVNSDVVLISNFR